MQQHQNVPLKYKNLHLIWQKYLLLQGFLDDFSGYPIIRMQAILYFQLQNLNMTGRPMLYLLMSRGLNFQHSLSFFIALLILKSNL